MISITINDVTRVLMMLLPTGVKIGGKNGQTAKLLISTVTINETIKPKNVYCVDKLPIRPNPILIEDDLT